MVSSFSLSSLNDDLANGVACPHCLDGDLLGHLEEIRRIGGVEAQLVDGAPRVGDDGRERLVDFVSQIAQQLRRREKAPRFHGVLYEISQGCRHVF